MGSVPRSDKAPGNAFLLFLGLMGLISLIGRIGPISQMRGQ